MSFFLVRSSVMACLFCVMALATTHSVSSSAAIPRPHADAELTVQLRDADDQPLTARVRIEPNTWRERVRLELYGAAASRTLTVVGTARLTLAAGEYRIVASRGPEWSLHREVLPIAADAQVLRVIHLVQQVSLPGWRGADLHVHTRDSSDAVPFGGVDAADLRAEGLDFAVATDHNRIGGFGAGIDAVPGVEITTWAPEVGHFNAFPVQRVPAWRGTSPARLAAELARDPHVFVQANHPRLERHIGYFALGGFDSARAGFDRPGFHLDLDGLEVWNGYDIARPAAVLDLLAEWRRVVARGRRITATGGSDCHGATGHHPGYPRTYVQAQAAGEMVPGLKAGRAFVTNGPLIALQSQGKGPGETVHVRGSKLLTVELTVLAPDWMQVEQAQVWVGERLAWQSQLPAAQPGAPLHFSATVHVRIDEARTLQAVVRGGRGLDALLGRTGVEPLAFTNPIFIQRAPREHAQR